MCNSTTFALRHTQISLSGIFRHFQPPSRHLLLNTHDTNMEFLQLSGPLLDIFLFFSKTNIFHSHPCKWFWPLIPADLHSVVLCWSVWCLRCAFSASCWYMGVVCFGFQCMLCQAWPRSPALLPPAPGPPPHCRGRPAAVSWTTATPFRLSMAMTPWWSTPSLRLTMAVERFSLPPSLSFSLSLCLSDSLSLSLSLSRSLLSSLLRKRRGFSVFELVIMCVCLNVCGIVCLWTYTVLCVVVFGCVFVCMIVCVWVSFWSLWWICKHTCLCTCMHACMHACWCACGRHTCGTICTCIDGFKGRETRTVSSTYLLTVACTRCLG